MGIGSSKSICRKTPQECNLVRGTPLGQLSVTAIQGMVDVAWESQKTFVTNDEIDKFIEIEIQKQKEKMPTISIEKLEINVTNAVRQMLKNRNEKCDENRILNILSNVLAYTQYNKPYSQLNPAQGFSIHNAIKYGSSAYKDCGITIGCLHASCPVMKKINNQFGGDDIQKVPLNSIQSGDLVLTDKGFKKVAYVVCSKVTTGVKMYKIDNSCIVTYGHPVWDGVDWTPVQNAIGAVAVAVENIDGWVYDVVIPGASAINIDGTLCLGLGHGVITTPAMHDVLGNLEVVMNMVSNAHRPSDGNGAVPVKFIRDLETGWINNIIRHDE